MLSIEDAFSRVLAHARPTEPERRMIRDARGAVLAEDVASDVDSPPHDKAMVDGYAVVHTDLAGGSAELAVLEEVTAGMTPTRQVGSGTATRIMTGAPLPVGADAVVMVERTEMLASGQVRIAGAAVRPGQNIMPRATSLERGQVVLERGHRLRGIEIGLLAEVGRREVLVHRAATVAVLATGNELVAADQPLAASMIRNSNGPMLLARVEEAGGKPLDLGIARDDAAELGPLIQRGLDADVLMVSGGVSAGVLDLVPRILDAAGVERVFHKIDLKPGKPLWFGVLRRQDRPTLVFGLPGNPVSGLVCFELLVRPALRALHGETDASRFPELAHARLCCDYSHRGDRVTFHPARLQTIAGALEAEPLRWHGSADLKTLASADALIRFAPGERLYKAGELVPVWRLLG